MWPGPVWRYVRAFRVTGPPMIERMYRAAILTVSDGVASGTRLGTSGDSLEDGLTSEGYDVETRRVVSDTRDEI